MLLRFPFMNLSKIVIVQTFWDNEQRTGKRPAEGAEPKICSLNINTFKAAYTAFISGIINKYLL